MNYRRKFCRVCSSTGFVKVIDLKTQPLANAFLDKKDFKAEKKYPLRLYFCKNCHLLQLLDVVSADTLFGDYVYVSSTSPSFVSHFESYAEDLNNRFGVKGKLVIDLGSNDGILLKPLKELGANILGIDPAKDIAKKATKEGIETWPVFFSLIVADKILEKKGQAKVVTANNAFAHIDDSRGVIEGVKKLLSNDGVFIIEVPYLVDFLEKKLFDTIYHEHLSYFAVEPLVKLMNNSGMNVFDVTRVSSHGGSIRVFVQKKDGPYAAAPGLKRLLKKEKEFKLDKVSTYKKFATEVVDNKKRLINLVKSLKLKGAKIAGYGAPAKGNTLLNYVGIDNKFLKYIVDDSPYKQGLFTPGTHVPVVDAAYFKKDPPDFLIVLAWNYAESIISKCREFQERGGKFIIPVPKPKII